MSPYGNAGTHNQSLPNSGNKFPLVRPITVQNFVTIRQEVSEISAVKKFVLPEVRQTFSEDALTKTPNLQNLVAID